MWPFNPKVETAEGWSPTIGASIPIITEQFKGEVPTNKVTFPDELGEEHPFKFEVLEGLYKKYGFFTAVIDKYVDFVVGPGFFIECEDERAKTIIEDFMRDVNFDTILRAWTKEALIKGNGFLEIGGNPKEGIKGLKVLNANYMYVDRDNKGKIKGYNQYKGAFDRFSKTKVINFKPNEMAHFAFNHIGDCAYGLGIGFPALKLIDNSLDQSDNLHMLMKKKANAPIHAKLGKVDGNIKIIPKPADVAAFGQHLETLDNKREWATDPLVEFKVLDYGNVGTNFETVLKYDLDMLIYAFQIPAVLLGMANIPEGLANVQMDAFQRRIQSIQAELEKVIEQNIFKRVLAANGFVKNSKGTDVHVEFEWGAPSTLAVEGRMTLLSELIKSPTTSPALKELLESEMVQLLDLDEDEWEKLKAKEEEERKRLEARPQPIVPGQNAKFPQKPAAQKPPQPKPQPPRVQQKFGIKTSLIPIMNIKEKAKEVVMPIKKPVKKHIRESNKQKFNEQKQCPHCTEGWDNINDIEEWLGFNYKKYLGSILAALKTEEFVYLKALNDIEEQAGYLSAHQLEQLRGVLDNGLKKGTGMKAMAKMVDKKVGLKDLYRMEGDKIKLGVSGLPILSRSKDKRAISIVRSEVTKVANDGAVAYYKENGIDRVKWIASFGDRTCPECETLNGQIFEINEYPDIPLHAMCRCTLAPVVELK